jgi:hypothetical protein
MRTEIMMVTPEMARSWLSNQVRNRKLIMSHVKYLANEIRQGRWRLSPQGIAFGDNGQLLDGQHRLRAIIEAGIAVKMLVVFDSPLGNFPILDRGVSRNMEAITGIPKYYAEIYGFLLSVINPKQKVSPDDIVKLHDYLEPYVNTLYKHCPNKVRYYSSTPIRTAVIVNLINNSEDTDYILNTYKALVLRQSKEMPLIADSLRRSHENDLAVNKNGMADFKNRVETYYRAMHVLTRVNADKRLQMVDSMRSRYLIQLQSLVNGVINNNEPDSQFREVLLQKVIEDKNRQIADAHKVLINKRAIEIENEQSKLALEAR